VLDNDHRPMMSPERCVCCRGLCMPRVTMCCLLLRRCCCSSLRLGQVRGRYCGSLSYSARGCQSVVRRDAAAHAPHGDGRVHWNTMFSLGAISSQAAGSTQGKLRR
jgi:hypothetical protein